ncbi:hypothetical protein FA048_11350 [Pedobacter polaris]|uniref:Uncharacterized protein n=1 Tax=Pedobacter polaris TaxID=2571273 RepID=A0A4U1CUG9_9SPHI|nr:hypothetical protein [Pedobacter polaris]TKC10760.1 hypothetical protein FA048_11350 [Pedobacter polaris]
MKIKNIISLIIFGLFSLSIYFSIVANFPYVLYFVILVPILFFGCVILYRSLGREERKWERDNAQREWLKKRKQDEWDKLTQGKKDKIFKGIKTSLKAKRDKDAKEYRQRIIDNKNAEKLVEENRLIIINEENEKQERFRQVLEAKEKESKELKIEKYLVHLQEEKVEIDSLDKHNNISLTYDVAYFKARWDDEVGFEIVVSIEKNNINNKIHYLENVFDFGVHLQKIDKEFLTIEEALKQFYVIKEPRFYFYKLIYIDSSQIFSFTKKLINALNINQHKKIENLNTDYFKCHLGIELKLIEDANEKGLQVIKLIKSKNTLNEIKSFFIGNISIEGSMVTINDENNNIIYLTSNENVTVETEIIDESYYWYFKK